MQLLPEAQAEPQPPQFAESELVSTQVLLQFVFPGVHPHWPPTHSSEPEHVEPQPPQLAGSF